MRRPTISQVCFALAAFLIPFIGGQISTDLAQPLPPGIGNLLRSTFGGPMLQGMETPLLSHLAIGILLSAGMAASLIQRSVIQLPNIKLAGATVVFFGLLFISVGLSDFRSASMAAVGEWLLYALAFFGAVAVLGRRDGPRLVLGSFYVGACLLALYGIGVEYQQMRSLDPNYRIFLGWVNPNAAAGILVIAILVGLGFAQTLDRVPKLLSGIGVVLVASALFLTGSKAGFGAAIVGTLTYALVAGFWSKSAAERVSRGVGAIAVLAIGFAVFFGIQQANKAPTSTSPGIGRIATYNETQAQSLGFRKLLWKGSWDLSVKHPTGYGLGTYRFEGSRPGLTTQTQLAHNNVLQLAVEASWIAAALFMATFLWWLVIVFRGARSMSDESNLLRAGVVAALVATFAHGVFESNLYYFGIGLSFYLLMGVGLCLSADSVAPEFTPRGARIGFAFATVIPVLLLAAFGWAEWQRTQIRHAIQSGDRSIAQELAQRLTKSLPIDGEAWNTLYMLDQRKESIERAAAMSPVPRILRNLAKHYEAEGKFASAEGAIDRALIRDPNNLNSLLLGMEVSQKFGDRARAKYYAERMVAVEKTPYYQIRALPQLVETSTADARIYLATLAPDDTSKAGLLQGALDIFLQYVQATVPEVKRFSEFDGGYAGERREHAIEKCLKGAAVARNLSEVYRSMGATDKSTEAGGKAGLFEEAITSLGGTR